MTNIYHTDKNKLYAQLKHNFITITSKTLLISKTAKKRKTTKNYLPQPSEVVSSECDVVYTKVNTGECGC